MIQSSHLAEDIVQETFLKLYDNINNYKEQKAKFSTYLYKIAYNTTLNTIRSLKKEKDLLRNLKLNLQAPKLYDDPYYQLEKQEFINIIKDIITLLPLAEGTIFVLKTESKMTYNEIAEILDISRRTVIRKMNSALKKLNKELKRLKII